MMSHPPSGRPQGTTLPALAGILAALLLGALCGCRPASKAALPPSRPSLTAAAGTEQTDPSLGTTDAGNYRAIGERDLFRPLVAAPKSAGGAGGAGETKGGAGTKAGGKAGPNTPPGGPPRPPDPTADLALTGIIETTDGLRALVEQISTRKGEFVAPGERAFGFTVKTIAAGVITLAQGPKTYDLRLGAKEMPTVEPAAAAAPSSAPTPSASSSPSGPPSGMPDFGGMSSDQRRQAFQNWWNNMPEDQRQQFRNRRGGGGFGGPGGGFGGGRGGRGGPPGR
jgi:hypothetical protein